MVAAINKIFTARPESLYEFVAKNGQGLYIPAYQRDYAWQKANVERLVEDTIQGIGAYLANPEESITFIGTVITMDDVKKSTLNPILKNQVYGQVMTIIDGQQRLSTLLMMSLALLIEIEIKWEELESSKFVSCKETKEWVENRVRKIIGILSQLLVEQQHTGDDEYKYFPRMIRAFKDPVNVKLVVTVFDFYAALFCIVSRSGLRASLS